MEMDREELMQFILDHYENPRNYGTCDDADVVQKGGNPGCGDIITLYLKLDDDEKVEEISFEGEGCIISQAATSIITELVKGKSIGEIENMTSDLITDIIGKDLAMTRPRCTTLGITTVKLAIKEWRKNQLIESIERDKNQTDR
jgi:nitrogen fixation protein NifU and related proteins